MFPDRVRGRTQDVTTGNIIVVEHFTLQQDLPVSPAFVYGVYDSRRICRVFPSPPTSASATTFLPSSLSPAPQRPVPYQLVRPWCRQTESETYLLVPSREVLVFAETNGHFVQVGVVLGHGLRLVAGSDISADHSGRLSPYLSNQRSRTVRSILQTLTPLYLSGDGCTYAIGAATF